MKQAGNAFKKALSITLCLTFAGTCAISSGSAKSVDGICTAANKQFEITSPYDDIDFSNIGSYKTQLHCHTNASDGYLTIAELTQKSYDYDYDIVALTDHGTLNRGWNEEPQLIPILRYVKKERTKLADIIPLSQETYDSYINGTAESETRTHDNGMLDVPLGIELNFVTPVADCHLTGYFSEYGQGLTGVYGDYETPSEGVREAGGISMLSHVGHYVYTDKDSENYVGQPVDEYYVNKFARVFMDNAGSSVGMGINSSSDSHTRCDRILYDQILQKTIPNGVIPWGFCFSDAHSESSINDAYQIMLMDEFNMDSFRESMVSGASFAVSHYSNGVELNGMEEIPGYSKQRVEEEKLNELNNTPCVTSVKVDEENDTITIEGENFNSITWVSNCNVIRRDTDITSGTATIDLHATDLLDTPELYVRFYITGDNGICYSQPFVLNVEGESFESVDVPETHDISTFLRGLVTVVDWIFFKFNPLIWLFKYYAVGYSVFDVWFK